MPSNASFTMICGADDYLVAREGAAHWQKLCAKVEDEYSREIVDGAAGNVSEVEQAVASFKAAVMTMPMFGGRKCVWLRSVSFLADNQTGRSEGAKAQVAKLLDVLGSINAEDVGVLITASPVDRRRREYKQFQSAGEVVFIDADGKGEAAARILDQEFSQAGLRIANDVSYALLEKIHGSSRMAVIEAQKLALYADELGKSEITMDMVNELVPPFGEGDFFEAVDAFYGLNLDDALLAIRKHFFAGNDIRPLLTSLQNRARLLLQLRVLYDAGYLAGGVNKRVLEKAKERFGSAFQSEAKSSSNVFTQNPFYLGRLLNTARQLKPKKIIDFQIEFVSAFEQSISRPTEHEAVMKELAVRCLGSI